MSTYRTEGIILRRSDFGEANLLLQIYTRDLGKIEIVGKSARKAQGKLKGHLEPFLYCDFVIVHGRKMDVVANSFILENFLRMRNDIEAVFAAAIIVEVANRMILDGYKDERIFYLLLESLRFIDGLSGESRKNLCLLILFFEINLLSLSGFAPHLDKCVFCGEKLKEGGNYFSNSLGGVMDGSCAKKCPDVIPVSDETIKLLKFIRTEKNAEISYEERVRNKLAEIEKISVKSEVLLKSVVLMRNFIEFNLDQKINSLDVFFNFIREKI